MMNKKIQRVNSTTTAYTELNLITAVCYIEYYTRTTFADDDMLDRETIHTVETWRQNVTYINVTHRKLTNLRYVLSLFSTDVK